MADEKKEIIAPRFRIQKKRISGLDKNGESAETSDFSPDKVIYVEIDEEITSVFDRIKRTRGKNLALVVPKRAILLQSVVNLKILKNKLDELDKEVLIVTSDASGLQLAEKAGISAVEKIFDTGSIASTAPVMPISRNERPIRVTGKKVSLSEIIPREKHSILKRTVSIIKEHLKKRKAEKKNTETRLIVVAPNKQALFTLILVSVLLLLVIAYIALPGATVYLTPKSSILDPSFNVTFADVGKNPYALENKIQNSIVVLSHKLAPPVFERTFTRPATGKIFKGQNARGVITITNTSNAPWDLAAKTRFQTADGIVFRIQEPVRVPAATASTDGTAILGTLDVPVVADEFDANGQIVGDRGNISPSKFFLPGLKSEESRKKLFGESKNPTSGGLTQLIKTVSREDIEAARQTVEKEIYKNAADDLQRYLEQQNLVNRTNLSLLTDSHTIQISNIEISVPQGLEGREAEQFEITTSYKISGIAFDRQQLVNTLMERLLVRADPDKRIISTDEDDISYRFLDSDERAGKIRLTVTVRAIQVYELDPDKENGHRFLKKITDHITGMRIKDAQQYLQQQTNEIANVEIRTWPVWAPTIPNIADNIKFVIEEKNILR